MRSRATLGAALEIDDHVRAHGPNSRATGLLEAHWPEDDAPEDLLVEAATYRFTDRLFGSTLVRFAIWVALLAYIFPGIFTDPFKLADYMDDHQFVSWEWSDRETFVRWFQIPMWNPYWCGGTAGASAPEDSFFGVDFIFRLIYGVEHGRRLAIGLMAVMGMEGTYRLARQLDSSVVAAFVPAVLFSTCNWFIQFVHDGCINFYGFQLIPWTCLCFLRGFTSQGWRLLGGFFIAWTLLTAGTYPLPFTVLVLMYLFFVYEARALVSKDRSSALPPLKSIFVMGVTGIGLSLVKLIPMLMFLRQFPRVFTPVEINSALALLGPFWDRYGILCLLAFVALAFGDRRAGVFFGGALLFLALACGDFATFSPFHLLKSLPIFGQLRIPQRYLVLVTLFIGIAAARGLTRAQDAAWRALVGLYALVARFLPAMRGEPQKAAGAILLLVVTLASIKIFFVPVDDIVETGKIKPATMFTLDPPRTFAGHFHQSRGNRRDAHIFTAANLGSLYCVAGNPIPESALLRGDLQDEEYPEDPAKATVKELSWSPQAIDLEVDAKEPTTIRINQNYSPNWRSDVGTVRDEEKLFVVDVPAGKSTVHLRYRDYVGYFCLAVSIATLIGVLRYAFRRGRDFLKRERAAFKSLPVLPVK